MIRPGPTVLDIGGYEGDGCEEGRKGRRRF